MSAGLVSSESSERESVLGLFQLLMANSNPWLLWLVAASLPSLSPSSCGVLCVPVFKMKELSLQGRQPFLQYSPAVVEKKRKKGQLPNKWFLFCYILSRLVIIYNRTEPCLS